MNQDMYSGLRTSLYLCEAKSENGSGPTASGPTFYIYCTLCSNLKGRISIDFIILMLLGLI